MELENAPSQVCAFKNIENNPMHRSRRRTAFDIAA